MTLNNIVLALVFVSMSWVACEPAKEKRNVPDSATSAAPVSEQEVTRPAPDSAAVEDWGTFETVYSHVEEGTTQKLGVKYLPDNKIDFRLSEENNLCEVNYGGIAQNQYPDGDGESDDDEEGNGYFAIEYIFEDAENIIYIRIAEEKDKARIKFVDKTKEETDCVPSPDFLLKR